MVRPTPPFLYFNHSARKPAECRYGPVQEYETKTIAPPNIDCHRKPAKMEGNEYLQN
jgi:hypothetical protein